MSNREVFIVGVGMTPFGEYPALAVADLARAVIDEALADAGCDRSLIQGAWFANTGQGALDCGDMKRITKLTGDQIR